MKISLSIMSYYSFFPPDFCKTKCLAWYLAELTLLDAETYSSFKPSIIAAACVALARHNDGLEAWDSIITKMTGIGVEELKGCLVLLHESFLKAPQQLYQAVVEKYKSNRFEFMVQSSNLLR